MPIFHCWPFFVGDYWVDLFCCSYNLSILYNDLFCRLFLIGHFQSVGLSVGHFVGLFHSIFRSFLFFLSVFFVLFVGHFSLLYFIANFSFAFVVGHFSSLFFVDLLLSVFFCRRFSAATASFFRLGESESRLIQFFYCSAHRDRTRASTLFPSFENVKNLLIMGPNYTKNSS